VSGARPGTATRPPWRPAARAGAASGLLAVSLSLALQLLGLPGLLQAVGGGLVVFTPGPVFGTLIDALQERGRPLLVLGTAVLLVVVAALAAVLVSRFRPPRWQVALLGAAGLWLLTLPLVAVAQGGLGTSATWATLLEWMVALLPPTLPQLAGGRRSGSPRRDLLGSPLSRRRFLELVGGSLGVVSLGYLGVRAIAASPPAPASGSTLGRLPAPVTPSRDFYVVSKDLFGPPRISGSSWRLSLAGSRSLSLTLAQLSAMPQVDQFQTLECISNPVGGTLISNGSWRGVPLAGLVELTGVPPGTDQLVFDCADGYTESLDLAQGIHPGTLLALSLDGRPLPAEHGYPARILAPGLYGMKNPKWLTGVRFTKGSYSGYWEQQGWNPAALPRTFSRFDFPAASGQLSGGRRYLLSGVAYAGLRGISQVEVSVDGGRSWRRARLEPPLSPYCWTIWSLLWAPAPGLYQLTVRATDGSSRPQTTRATGSYPKGATGLQQLQVEVG
jgi:DMSO/TMAO reductase YedYZ molybdopterin-dependent catalytic subunit